MTVNLLVNKSVNGFLDELASKSPAPGGGSVAALAGALGAALSSMVCNLTLGKEGYESVQDDIQDVFTRSERLRHHLTTLIDKDTEVFTTVVHAVKLPKETDQQKEKRHQALQEAYKAAAQVPLETARACLQVLDLAQVVAEKGNKNSLSDAAVSALLAHAGVESAALNVKINLGAIKDEGFVQKLSSEVQDLRQQALEQTRHVVDGVERSLSCSL